MKRRIAWRCSLEICVNSSPIPRPGTWYRILALVSTKCSRRPGRKRRETSVPGARGSATPRKRPPPPSVKTFIGFDAAADPASYSAVNSTSSRGYLRSGRLAPNPRDQSVLLSDPIGILAGNACPIISLSCRTVSVQSLSLNLGRRSPGTGSSILGGSAERSRRRGASAKLEQPRRPFRAVAQNWTGASGQELFQSEDWRRGWESNPRVKVLQTSPLPLGYRASTAVASGE